MYLSFVRKILYNALHSEKSLLPRMICTSVQHHNYYVPIVLEQSGKIERAYDIYSRLLKDRIVCMIGPIHDALSGLMIAQLLYLQSESNKKPIHMYINSPGGSITAGLAIYDAMQFITAPVHTWCLGQAASMGAVLLAGGEKDYRHSLPHARIMIHQPSGQASGQASDIRLLAEEIMRLKHSLNELLAKHTGQDVDVIESSVDRDRFMSAEEAVAFGIVDKVTHRAGVDMTNNQHNNNSSGNVNTP